MGSYDPYSDSRTLEEKIGGILKGVESREQKEYDLDK